MCRTGSSVCNVMIFEDLAHFFKMSGFWLTHWGGATHICVSKLTIIASDNGLSPGRRQAIIWNKSGILSIGLLGTKCSEILIKILTFPFKKMHLKVSSAKWRPFCLSLNVLMDSIWSPSYCCQYLYAVTWGVGDVSVILHDPHHIGHICHGDVNSCITDTGFLEIMSAFLMT